MKKFLLCLISAILLLFSAIAHGEEITGAWEPADPSAYATGFTLRNDLHFGVTADEITTAEHLTRLSGMQLTAYGTLQYSGTIAGIDDSLVGYFLDDNGRLNQMFYRFSPTSLDNGYVIFHNLLSQLTEKYGEPLEDFGGSYRVLAGTVTQKAGPWVLCREWFLPVDNCFVKIDLMMSNRAIVPGLDFDGNLIRYVMVDYTSFTREEVVRLLQQYEAEQRAIRQEL